MKRSASDIVIAKLRQHEKKAWTICDRMVYGWLVVELGRQPTSQEMGDGLRAYEDFFKKRSAC